MVRLRIYSRTQSVLRPAILAAVLLLLLGAAAAQARTFYVSPHGSDRASGRSPARAWRTVERVDKAHLRPGDTVLFQGGARFSDDTLMPGWGLSVSGRRGLPVVFGSYGSGRASLPQGVWIKNEHDLVFQDFQLGPQEGVSGNGSHVTIENCVMRNFFGSVESPIEAIGADWRIVGNTIDHTGDSGMILWGTRFLVVGNTITNTGEDPKITYGSHGVYLKATASTVADNTIIHFRDNGVSVRYSNSTVRDNFIKSGKFGIAWFQYDHHRGDAHWYGNTIEHTSIAGIYVSPRDRAGQTDENFIIYHNLISRPVHIPHEPWWKPIALSRNRGWYKIYANHIVA